MQCNGIADDPQRIQDGYQTLAACSGGVTATRPVSKLLVEHSSGLGSIPDGKAAASALPNPPQLCEGALGTSNGQEPDHEDVRTMLWCIALVACITRRPTEVKWVLRRGGPVVKREFCYKGLVRLRERAIC